MWSLTKNLFGTGQEEDRITILPACLRDFITTTNPHFRSGYFNVSFKSYKASILKITFHKGDKVTEIERTIQRINSIEDGCRTLHNFKYPKLIHYTGSGTFNLVTSFVCHGKYFRSQSCGKVNKVTEIGQVRVEGEQVDKISIELNESTAKVIDYLDVVELVITNPNLLNKIKTERIKSVVVKSTEVLHEVLNKRILNLDEVTIETNYDVGLSQFEIDLFSDILRNSIDIKFINNNTSLTLKYWADTNIIQTRCVIQSTVKYTDLLETELVKSIIANYLPILSVHFDKTNTHGLVTSTVISSLNDEVYPLCEVRVITEEGYVKFDFEHNIRNFNDLLHNKRKSAR